MSDQDEEQPTVHITMDVGTVLLVQAILELERGELVEIDDVADEIRTAIKYLETDRRRKESTCSNLSAS